jgi:3-hydroxymyristoyl/3-hydroxydecanoyl-(acyl carrier protein) dehydratase
MAELHGEFTLPADHPIFAGHFPGRPIVPGVMLLEWVLGEVARTASLPAVGLRLREVKFFQPLSPGERAALRLDLAAARAAFEIRSDTAAIARGIVEWDRD